MCVGVARERGRGPGRLRCFDAEDRDGHRRRRPQRPRLQPPRLRRHAPGAEAPRRPHPVAESRSPADYIPNLASFARQGYDLVLGVGYTEIGAMGAVAKRFPKTRFAIVDVANGDLAGKPKNVLGLLFHEEQVGYLAGYLAGLETKRLPGTRRGQLGRGREAAARRPLRRRLPGGRETREPARDRDQRLLPGLQRPGEVQGDRAQPDRGGLGRGVRRRRRLRPRRARRGPGAEGLGDRRRLRPVVPRRPHPHERDEEGRPGSLPRDQVGRGRTVPRRQCRLRPRGQRRRAGEDQPAGAEGRGRRAEPHPGPDRRREDRPAEDPLAR